jgi:uncharacterized membrane protein
MPPFEGGFFALRGEGLDEREKARAKLTDGLDDAVSFLFEVLKDECAKTEHRIKAAGEIIDRGLGKPRQDETPMGGELKFVICEMIDIAGV